MLYCPKCKRLCQDICPEGGKRHKLREVEPLDPVRLMALPFNKGMMVEPVLEETGIPYSRTDQMGWGLTLRYGTLGESLLFYVPASAYDAAKEAVLNVFIEDPDVRREFGLNDAHEA